MSAYVPYQFWREADPKLASVLQNSLVSYRHEVLLDNVASIPILQQHGDGDDNVPTYHSRRLKQLITESGWSSRYVELVGKGHWFDGIMTTKPLRDFYHNISRDDTVMTQLPDTFLITVPNSGDMGSRGGIIVDQLISPDQLGKISVVRSSNMSKWTMQTSNIHRLHFSQTRRSGKLPDLVEIDHHLLDVRSSTQGLENCWLVHSYDGSWTAGLSAKSSGVETDLGRYHATIAGRQSANATEPNEGRLTLCLGLEVVC